MKTFFLCVILAIGCGSSSSKDFRVSPTFFDAGHFSSMCHWYIPDSKLVWEGITSEFIVSCFWDETSRVLTVFDIPLPSKHEAWNRRLSDSFALYQIKDEKLVKLEKISAPQTKPLMFECEIREATNELSKSSIYGFPIGVSIKIPPKILELNLTTIHPEPESIKISLKSSIDKK
jgi:hypothetical protein